MKAKVALLPLLGSILSGTSALSTDPKTDAAPEVVPGAYIVEFHDKHDSGAFYGDLSAEHVEVDSRMELSYSLFKGCSFQLKNTSDPDAAAQKISELPGVKKIWPVRILDPPDARVQWTGDEETASRLGLGKRQDNADTFIPHRMTQVDRLRADGITGEGLRIAIVDSGLNYHHPALGNGCFGPGCLVSYGRDLVGNDYNGGNAPVPDDDPDDECNGHGTHVAGIIAAQANSIGFTGAAPGVTLGAYRVFGCRGSMTEDILFAAFNEAYEEGSDIITASISALSGWSEDAMSVAIGRIVEAGVSCIFAAGNGGASGLFFAGSAANGKRITSVGSVDSEETPLILKDGSFTVDGSSVVEHFGWEPGSINFANVSLPLWALSQNTSVPDDACGPLPDDTPDLSEYMVLIRNGACGNDYKASNVAAKGAKNIMFYSNEDGLRYVWLPNDIGILGVGMVPADVGEKWVEQLNQGQEVTVKLTEPELAPLSITYTANTRGGYISDYSSWGPTWDLEFSPQFVTPGGNILSTYPLSMGGYAVVSGTSMAAPFAAAAFALVSQVRGTTDPSTLERLLSGTARATRWVEDPHRGLAPSPQQGSGLLQVYDAAHASTLLSVASISFNDTANFIPSKTFSIENLGAEDITYEISHEAALTMYTFREGSPRPASYPNPIADEAASLDFSTSKVTVPAGQSAEITVTAAPPRGLDASRVPVYSGFITVNGTNGDNLAIPYQGVFGSMYDMPKILSEGYVYLSTWTDPLLSPAPANSTFRLPYPVTPLLNSSIGYPAAIVELNVGSPFLRCDVVPLDPESQVNTTEVLGVDIVGSILDYPKEHVARRYFVTAISGTLEDGSVLPEGRYALLVRALRIFGDREKAEDYEVERMLPFSIEYF